MSSRALRRPVRRTPARCLGGACLVLLPLLWTTTALAAVTARLEPPLIDEFETTRLIVRSTNGSQTEPPNLDALAGDFDVLGTQTVSRYQVSNGVIEAWVEYQVTLQPLRPGPLTIPSLTVAGEQTSPLLLNVRGVDSATRAALGRMAFFELEVTPEPVYVRAETILTRRLYYSAETQIYSDLPGPPEITDALVLPIGETSSGTVIRDGERYGVIEQRFAVFPERPGTLTIPSIALTSSVRLPVAGRLRRTSARIVSPARAIEVLPIPGEYPADAPWLPARSVTVTDRWKPERAAYQVGEALSRQVEVRVFGNLAAAVTPPLDQLPDLFRQYAEPAVLTDQKDGSSVIGSRATAYSIVPIAPGTTAVPPLSITWWDVEARRVQTTVVPSRAVVIEGTAAADQPADGPIMAADAAAPPAAAQATAAASTDWSAGAVARRWLPTALAGSALALGLWWCMTWALPRRNALAAHLQSVTRRLRRDTAARGVARSVRLRLLRRRLLAARGHSSELNGALLDYLCCWYATTPEHALARFRAAGHGPLLERLHAARFSRAATPPPAPTELLTALAQEPAPRRVPPDPLPELFCGR